MKARSKSTVRKLGLWRFAVMVHDAARRLQRIVNRAAAGLTLSFGVQLKLLPPTILLQLMFVSPSSITHVLTSTPPPENRPVWDGEWDINKEPLVPGPNGAGAGFRTIYEMFADGKPIEDTSQYKVLEMELLTGGETIGEEKYRTREQIFHHLKRYEQIFNDIKENGYKSQEDQGNPRLDLDGKPRFDEIRVYIGRDGGLIYRSSGVHRLAMARILGIEYIPVGVQNVHRIWAERCFKKYGGGVLDAVSKGIQDIDRRHLMSDGDSPQPVNTQGLSG